MTHRVPWLSLLPGGKTTPRPPVARICPHWHLLIDEEAGLVECGDCGDELDPYMMLARYAEEETRLDALRREISADLAKGVLACIRCGAVPGKGGK